MPNELCYSIDLTIVCNNCGTEMLKERYCSERGPLSSKFKLIPCTYCGTIGIAGRIFAKFFEHVVRVKPPLAGWARVVGAWRVLCAGELLG